MIFYGGSVNSNHLLSQVIIGHKCSEHIVNSSVKLITSAKLQTGIYLGDDSFHKTSTSKKMLIIKEAVYPLGERLLLFLEILFLRTCR
jgi:hypothetical protein